MAGVQIFILPLFVRRCMKKKALATRRMPSNKVLQTGFHCVIEYTVVKVVQCGIGQ